MPPNAQSGHQCLYKIKINNGFTHSYWIAIQFVHATKKKPTGFYRGMPQAFRGIIVIIFQIPWNHTCYRDLEISLKLVQKLISINSYTGRFKSASRNIG